MLAELQQQHCATYGMAAHPDVRDYLVTNVETAQAIAPAHLLAGSNETLLLAEDDDGLALSLFLDQALLERLEATDPLGALKPGALADFWQVMEGISHFNTVVHRAHHDRRVSLLELELQAEVDKFITALQCALAQGDGELARRLHGWLFDEVSFHEQLDPHERERYRTANDMAARFCRRLGDAMIGDVGDVRRELRRFFRLPAADKISHINTRCS